MLCCTVLCCVVLCWVGLGWVGLGWFGLVGLRWSWARVRVATGLLVHTYVSRQDGSATYSSRLGIQHGKTWRVDITGQRGADDGPLGMNIYDDGTPVAIRPPLGGTLWDTGPCT